MKQHERIHQKKKAGDVVKRSRPSVESDDAHRYWAEETQTLCEKLALPLNVALERVGAREFSFDWL